MINLLLKLSRRLPICAACGLPALGAMTGDGWCAAQVAGGAASAFQFATSTALVLAGLAALLLIPLRPKLLLVRYEKTASRVPSIARRNPR